MALSSVRTALWHAKRGHWPHLIGTSIEKLRRRSPQAAEAREWCRHRAIAGTEAITGIVGTGSLPNMPTQYIDEAARRVADVTTRMGGAAKLDLLFAVTFCRRPLRVIETGVALGWSSLAILAAFRESGNVDGALISVDMPYPRRGTEAFVGKAVPNDFRRQWTLIKKPDRNGLKQAIHMAGGLVDIAHYDSDKSYGGRMFAYPCLWRAIRPSGIFISDDISDNMAFADFFGQHSPVVIEHQGRYVGLVRKPE